ncbi:MAG: PilZ domain-containing protein [Hyphomicrobiales bacterium]
MTTEDKRAARRSRVLKDGKIVSMNYSSVVDCSVRDVSATGARIRCDNLDAVPDEFQLLIQSDNLIRPVKVVWRRNDLIGLQFTGEARRAPPRKW